MNTKLIKKCSKCGEEIEKSGYCKNCKSIYNKEYRQLNKEYLAKYGYNVKHNGYYLYIILNKNNTVLYVGATESIKNRIDYQHIKGHSHLKELMLSAEWDCIKYLDITNIVQNREEMLMLENELIDLYNTKYNDKKSIIKNVEPLRRFSLLAEIHSLTQNWITYCKNKKAY